MIDRYTINICDCALGTHIKETKSDSGDWVKYENFKSFLVTQTCLDYFRSLDKAEKWLDENGTELMKMENLNSIKEIKDAIITINQKKNKN